MTSVATPLPSIRIMSAPRPVGTPPVRGSEPVALMCLQTSFSDEREQVVHEGDGARQFAWGPQGASRPCRQGARPRRHHRRDHLDGLIHRRLMFGWTFIYIED